MLLIEEEKYTPENTITDSQTIIICNHMYQHCVFHIVKDIDDSPVSMNVEIHGFPGTGKKIIANTIFNIVINLNSVFIIYLLYSDRVSYFINQWNNLSSIIAYFYWKTLSYDS